MKTTEKESEDKATKETNSQKFVLSEEDRIINACLKLRLLGDHIENLTYNPPSHFDFNTVELYRDIDVDMWLHSIFLENGRDYRIQFCAFLLDKQAGIKFVTVREALYELSRRLYKIHYKGNKAVMVPTFYRNPDVIDTLLNNSIQELMKLPLLPVYATISLMDSKPGTGRYLRFSKGSELVPMKIDTRSKSYKEMRKFLQDLKDRYLSDTQK